MKRYFCISLAIAAAALAAGSCGDLELNESQYVTKRYQFSNFAQVKEVMTNVYGYLESGFYNLQECATDDAMYAVTPDKVKSYYDGTWSASYTVDDVWSKWYSAIRAANYLLENCPEDFEDARWDEQYNAYLSQLKNYPYEARALRAFFHMELLKRYRNIIIADRTFTPQEVNNLVPSTYAECTKWIEQELKECAEKLPDTYSDTYYSEIGRVTKGFALAARARLLLYAASPLENPEGKADPYIKAAQAAQDFMNSQIGTYKLVRQAFNIESRDLIFGIREDNNNTYESVNFPVGYEGGGSGMCPTLNLVEAFDLADGTPFDYGRDKDVLLDASARDPRMAAAVLCNGSIFKGVEIESWTGGANGQPKANASPTSFYLRKFIQEATSFTSGSSKSFTHIYPLFRVQEVYLNYAEALSEAASDPDFKGTLGGIQFKMSPREALNTVRALYGMPGIKEGLKMDEFRARLRNERRVELCFEGHRYWDLRRWKVGELTKNIYGLAITKTGDGTFNVEKKIVQTRYWDEKMNTYPFSDVEQHRNVNLNQNTGW